MLAVLLRIVGATAVLVGAVWSTLILAMPTPAASFPDVAIAVISKVAAAAPGLAAIVCGLLLLAAAEALWHLQRIARDTKGAAQHAATLAEHVAAPTPASDAATTFGNAVQLFQARTGKTEAGAAIRELATDALRQKGLLV